MKTQICTREGFSGVQVSFNLFELQFILELAIAIEEYNKQLEICNKWHKDRDNAENKEDFDKQNPRPWAEEPRYLLDRTMDLWVRVAKSIPDNLDIENVFDLSSTEKIHKLK